MFIHGGHNRGPQMMRDIEKYNAAASLGWRILFFPTLNKDGSGWDEIFEMLKGMLR